MLILRAFISYQFKISDGTPRMAFGEIMNLNIVDLASPYSEQQIKPKKSKNHFNYDP